MRAREKSKRENKKIFAGDNAGCFLLTAEKGKMIHGWIEVFSSRRKKTWPDYIRAAAKNKRFFQWFLYGVFSGGLFSLFRGVKNHAHGD
jgi:hypothetical protein